ncbi:MAG: hypothetical protein VYA34_14215 [Myxococcota bacterium]|nr:hypothetical protein [Myxococcota bacterium]
MNLGAYLSTRKSVDKVFPHLGHPRWATGFNDLTEKYPTEAGYVLSRYQKIVEDEAYRVDA